MINIEKINQNAERINKNGLDGAVLKEAEKLFEHSKKIASGISYSDNTHLRPEILAHYIQLFDGNLNGLKTLDLGSGLLNYSPVLPVAFKELGANVYAVDLDPESREEDLKKLGINYKSLNLNFPRFFENYPDFFKGNDIIVARSFLDGGWKEDSDFGTYRNRQEEFNRYLRAIHKAKELNGQPALFELDVPQELTWEKNLDNGEVQRFLEDNFRAKIITGHKHPSSTSSSYAKPFVIL